MTIARIQKFKIAGTVWVTLCLLFALTVPAFASSPLPTDENGNWVPSSYYVMWQIFDPDTQTYNNVNVTSSLSVDGLTFTFPYNTTGVQRVQMNLYTGLSSNLYISGVSFSGYANYLGNQTIDSFTSNCNFTRYYFNQNGVNSGVSSSFGTSNPFSYSESFDTGAPFTRCLFTFYMNVVSGVLTIHFDSLLIGGQDISSMITVQNLDISSDNLGNLAEELAVPTPNIDSIFGGAPSAIAHINDQNYQNTYSFFKNDTGIMATYITIVLAMATLGYIFFGKRA